MHTELGVEMLKILKFATVVVLLAAPVAVHAQGIIGGMQRGAAQGNAVAGPLGRVTIATGRMSTARPIAITGTIAISGA
jgi:hypothetical protein